MSHAMSVVRGSVMSLVVSVPSYSYTMSVVRFGSLVWSSRRPVRVARFFGSCRMVVLQVPFVDVRVDASLEPLLFFVTKRHWPACQFYRKASNIINVTLISGIIMIPMILIRTDVLQYPSLDEASLAPLLHDVWIECTACSRFFPHYATDRASNLVFVRPHICAQLVAVGEALDDLLPASGVRDGGIRLCERHLWFSSNDLEYYETGGFGRELESPFAYEIACHGLLLNRHFMQVLSFAHAHSRRVILMCGVLL